MMDMNTAFFQRKEDRKPQWWIVDGEGLVVGRLATQIADVLRGKDETFYTPHTDSGDYVVVINADKLVLTGNKMEDKTYDRYSGYIGGYKVTTAKEYQQKHPGYILEHAVKGMLPKNKLARQLIKKLKVYAGEQHPHEGQQVKKLVLAE